MTGVTYSGKCYIAACAGCDCLFESVRSDQITCSPACRVRAHRRGKLKSIRESAALLKVKPSVRLHAAAIDRLRPDLSIHILAGSSRDSIHRHYQLHVSAEAKANYLAGPMQLEELAAKAADTGVSVLDNLHAIRVILMGHLASVTEAGDGRSAAYIAGRLTATLETIARVSGELGDLAKSTTFNITNNIAVLSEHPAFMKVQATILRALAEHPEARASVVEALRSLDQDGASAALPAPAKADMVIDHAA